MNKLTFIVYTILGVSCLAGIGQNPWLSVLAVICFLVAWGGYLEYVREKNDENRLK